MLCLGRCRYPCEWIAGGKTPKRGIVVTRPQVNQSSLVAPLAGEAWQNGYAERLVRTIKEEEVYLSDYRDYTVALKRGLMEHTPEVHHSDQGVQYTQERRGSSIKEIIKDYRMGRSTNTFNERSHHTRG